MKPSTVVIKKYGNRRLYDTSGSRYVNLEEIARQIREGAEVQVIDAKTGEDLTRVTLMQIITEDAKDKPTLPLELLRQLIVATDHARQEFMTWYLKSAFDTYQRVQEVMQSRLTEVQSAVMSPVDAMRRFLSGAANPRVVSENDSEIIELRKRVADLEARLALQKVTPRNAPKRARKRASAAKN